MKFEPSMHKLSNGITVFLDPIDIETVAMKIRINGGTRIEKPSEYGISHFLEHMLFMGSEKYPTSKIGRDLISDNGGVRGGATDLECTVYSGRILAENFHVLMDVLSDMILNPLILPTEIEKERGVIIQEKKRSLDNEDRKFNNIVNGNLFKNSYLEKYDGLGEYKNIESFTREELLKYKDEKYTANNIVIGISGNFGNAQKILNDLENLFGSVPTGTDIKAVLPVVIPTVTYDVRDDRKQTKLFVGFENGYPDERKYDYESICLGVFESALGRRISEEVREKRGLAYGIGVAGYGDRYVGVNGIMTSLSPEKLSDAIAAIASVCYDALHRNPVTIEELNRKKVMVRLGRADFMESSTSRRDKLITFYSMYGDLYNPDEFDEMRARITIEDVMKYSASCFDAPLNIIASGPSCDIDMRQVWTENFK